uniref:Uncharacterized protein n=1 Tax=Physcomitrium patens TaxID=3218 RepID=A0A7I3ZKB0_PHYPA
MNVDRIVTIAPKLLVYTAYATYKFSVTSGAFFLFYIQILTNTHIYIYIYDLLFCLRRDDVAGVILDHHL